ncbi:hypothetical protein EKD04_023270 [Chloroflexales bacterium ZM16-3]|nr:hypothetical protein [Chloroflexales bacterium ZM16-3]
MEYRELLATLEEGLENGRISPQTAAYIAAEILGVEAYETGYHEWDAARMALASRAAEVEDVDLALA